MALMEPDHEPGRELVTWWLARGEDQLPAVTDWLSAAERGRADTLRYAKRQTDFLLGRWTLMDAPAVVAGKVGLLNGIVVAGMLAGIVVQSKFDSWKANRGKRMKAKVMAGLSEDERNALKKAAAAKQSAFGKFFKPKKAG